MGITKDQKIIVKDDDNLRNIFIQVNMKKNTATVLSSFSAWENLVYILEGLGATAQECIREGKSKGEVKEAIDSYLKEVIKTYVTNLQI